MNSIEMKQMAESYGADLCGIASPNRFTDAPKGFSPLDVYPGCKSVIIVMSRFPSSSLEATTCVPYTFIRNRMVEKMESIVFQLCEALERSGHIGIPIPVDEPFEYFDEAKREGRAMISLKHAAVLAGLGTMGKNTLLVNDQYGNMTWLGGVLTSLDLEPDPLATYEGCMEDCHICIDSCPGDALDGVTIIQKKCREASIFSSEAGGVYYGCNKCRVLCPNCLGVKTGKTNPE